MASTSVHIPPAMVVRLDRLATQRGTIRNRIIVQACEDLLASPTADWPPGFFESTLSADDAEILRAAGTEMEDAIYASRHDRPVPSL